MGGVGGWILMRFVGRISGLSGTINSPRNPSTLQTVRSVIMTPDSQNRAGNSGFEDHYGYLKKILSMT